MLIDFFFLSMCAVVTPTVRSNPANFVNLVYSVPTRRTSAGTAAFLVWEWPQFSGCFEGAIRVCQISYCAFALV
ncbi:hypothetical protein B0T09DRAFT_329395 [Sordaria sp. MPI-SDFR-AT-0083]|nr:hypothetical protein B0T09DRAFT_329395 [Sordaria sp. MPI-SDFR-AT-0083]